MAEKEYIERDALSQAILDLPPKMDEQGYGWLGRRGVWQIVNDFPAADVRPVKRGKWIDRDDKYYGWNMWACSACGEEFVLTEGTPDMNDYHFCPNCGADMREES